jgi:hypothetical protein
MTTPAEWLQREVDEGRVEPKPDPELLAAASQLLGAQLRPGSETEHRRPRRKAK